MNDDDMVDPFGGDPDEDDKAVAAWFLVVLVLTGIGMWVWGVLTGQP